MAAPEGDSSLLGRQGSIKPSRPLPERTSHPALHRRMDDAETVRGLLGPGEISTFQTSLDSKEGYLIQRVLLLAFLAGAAVMTGCEERKGLKIEKRESAPEELREGLDDTAKDVEKGVNDATDGRK